MRYFKLVMVEDPRWLASEFREGRVRFGWSWPGMDLRILKEKSVLSEDEKISWRYTQFLVNRVVAGDRVVCQFGQPLREFWIGEVVGPCYEFDSAGLEDFNHILHIRPLTDQPIPTTAEYVPSSLKHDLTKRGQYYEIYPDDSIAILNQIVREEPWTVEGDVGTRTAEHDLEDAYFDIQREIVADIRRRWRAKEFETFSAKLCESIPYVEVKLQQDNHQGWDILLRIVNPVTGDVLLDNVPVQCKNYEGEVTELAPIKDLERCIRNSDSDLAYLFILGELSEEFLHGVDRASEMLSEERKRKIHLVVVDESRIADLYLRHVLGAQRQAESEI